MSNKDSNSAVLEIEVDDALNSKLFFKPLQRNIRGRLDFFRIREKQARDFVDAFPKGIPGQRLRLDATARTLQLIEPLRMPEHESVRDQIENSKRGRVPSHETFSGVHVPTMLYHMVEAVKCGLAKVVDGVLPTEIPGKPQKTFFSTVTENPLDKLTAAFEAQTAALKDQSAMFSKLLETVLRQSATATGTAKPAG